MAEVFATKTEQTRLEILSEGLDAFAQVCIADLKLIEMDRGRPATRNDPVYDRWQVPVHGTLYASRGTSLPGHGMHCDYALQALIKALGSAGYEILDQSSGYDSYRDNYEMSVTVFRAEEAKLPKVPE